MIVVQLQGGLGNQMFQYAFARALSAHYEVPMEFDLSFLNKRAEGYTQRSFSLEVFSLPIPVASIKTIQLFDNAMAKDLSSRIKRAFISSKNITHYEIGFPFQSVKYSPNQNNRYIGFWQSEKYFDSIREIITKDFAFPRDSSEQANAMRFRISSCDSISLHIRRGDYITNRSASQFHGSCSSEYYYKAVQEISVGLTNPELFIFSDDPNWVRQNLKFDLPSHIIDFNSGDRSHFDMDLMSCCAHHIIANSSFSWWGAWLNTKMDKRVIAPRKWFNDAAVETHDLIPSKWQQI
jgi:hypothetical protein